MRRLSRLAAALPLLVLSGAAIAAPVSATFTGIMADTAVDALGAFGPAGADLAGATMRTTIGFDTALSYTASGSDDQYTDAAPGSGAITISITIGGVTLTNISTYAGMLQAISIGADTEALGYAADAPGDMLGYSIASIAAWSAGMMDTTDSFEALLSLADPEQVQYLQVGTAPGQWEYLAFTPAEFAPVAFTAAATDPAVIAEPAAGRLLPIALLVLGVLRHRPTARRASRPARHLC
jgi:hypothetical protein